MRTDHTSNTGPASLGPATAARRQLARGPSHTAFVELLLRIQGEYREMPGLCLTTEQARRLWALDASTCESALRVLLDQGVLTLTAKGTYVRA
jgi:hypothetical protein